MPSDPRVQTLAFEMEQKQRQLKSVRVQSERLERIHALLLKDIAEIEAAFQSRTSGDAL